MALPQPEVEEMDERGRLTQRPRADGMVGISEPELDMRRDRTVQTSAFTRLRKMFGAMISGSGSRVSPMRSIARELEESWPTGEG
jgi:hypothetical protein